MTEEPWYQIKPAEPKKLFENVELKDILQIQSELLNTQKKLATESKPEKPIPTKNSFFGS